MRFNGHLVYRSFNFFQLARQGLNVVIMSRSQEKLQLVADEIRTSFTNL